MRASERMEIFHALLPAVLPICFAHYFTFNCDKLIKERENFRADPHQADVRSHPMKLFAADQRRQRRKSLEMYYVFLVLSTVIVVIESGRDEMTDNSLINNRVGRLGDFWFGNQNRKVDHFSNRASRFLSLFTFVQIGSQDCQATDGTYGTCLSSSADCARKGGAISGPCAGGFGTCCIFVVSCSRTIRENGTYFVNNGYPNQYDGSDSCQVTLMKSSPDVCQFRLNFELFSIMGPESENHICNNDQFLVSGGIPVPVICGDSTGNHMYIDAGAGVDSSITLSMVMTGPSFNRNWKIRVLQIPCTSLSRAEEGCLQYFTGVAGQILSYNYNPLTGAQLSNQDYGICIRSERNFCGIQYTQCPDPDAVNNRTQSFTLSGNSNNRVPAMVGSTGNSNFCQSDFLIIPMASNVGRPATGPSASVDRICGGVLAADVTMQPTTVRSTAKPFHLYFHTDGIEAPNDIDNKGFCLNYIQQPCASSLI